MKKIEIANSSDYGCEISADERQRYHDLVADTVAKAYPGASVEVYRQDIACDTRITLEGFDGADHADIQSDIRHILQDVWEHGEFWGPVP